MGVGGEGLLHGIAEKAEVSAEELPSDQFSMINFSFVLLHDDTYAQYQKCTHLST